MKFIAEDDALTIKLRGFEVLMGLRRTLVVPRENIADLEWTADFSYNSKLLRVGGAGLPGTLYAGNFEDLKTKELLWLYVHRPRPYSVLGGTLGTGGFSASGVLVIKTKDFKYSRVVVTCRPDIGKQLTGWWRS